MTWPDSRLRTYTPSSPVRSADLNAIQDQIVAMYTEGFVTPRWYSSPLESAQAESGAPVYDGDKWVLGAAAGIHVPLPHLNRGDTLNKVHLWFKIVAAATLTFAIRLRSRTAAVVTGSGGSAIVTKGLAAATYGTTDTDLELDEAFAFTGGDLPLTITELDHPQGVVLRLSGDATIYAVNYQVVRGLP